MTLLSGYFLGFFEPEVLLGFSTLDLLCHINSFLPTHLLNTARK